MLHRLTKQHYDNKLLPESVQNYMLFSLLGAVNSQQWFLNNCGERRNDSMEVPSKRVSAHTHAQTRPRLPRMDTSELHRLPAGPGL